MISDLTCFLFESILSVQFLLLFHIAQLLCGDGFTDLLTGEPVEKVWFDLRVAFRVPVAHGDGISYSLSPFIVNECIVLDMSKLKRFFESIFELIHLLKSLCGLEAFED